MITTYLGHSAQLGNTSWYHIIPPKKNRQREIAKTYGVSEEAALALLNGRQSSPCAICGMRKPGLKIDHDHKTQDIRGFLCLNCNMILGLAHEDKSILLAAVRYLEEHNAG